MPQRHSGGSDYRYGFQGQEKDDDRYTTLSNQNAAPAVQAEKAKLGIKAAKIQKKQLEKQETRTRKYEHRLIHHHKIRWGEQERKKLLETRFNMLQEWDRQQERLKQRQKREEEAKIAVIDFGVKRNILRILAQLGCRLTVVPAETPAADVLALNPDGVFLSNGPGDPDPCDYAIKAISEILKTDIPVFGICLGLQLLALAVGLKTKKMGHGHHGANHPVKNLAVGNVLISSQNHGFCIDDSSLTDAVTVTHRSLFDDSLQGIELVGRAAFGFQGHPEASPGPHDAAPLFDRFIEMMATRKAAA